MILRQNYPNYIQISYKECFSPKRFYVTSSYTVRYRYIFRLDRVIRYRYMFMFDSVTYKMHFNNIYFY